MPCEPLYLTLWTVRLLNFIGHWLCYIFLNVNVPLINTANVMITWLDAAVLSEVKSSEYMSTQP